MSLPPPGRPASPGDASDPSGEDPLNSAQSLDETPAHRPGLLPPRWRHQRDRLAQDEDQTRRQEPMEDEVELDDPWADGLDAEDDALDEEDAEEDEERPARPMLGGLLARIERNRRERAPSPPPPTRNLPLSPAEAGGRRMPGPPVPRPPVPRRPPPTNPQELPEWLRRASEDRPQPPRPFPRPPSGPFSTPHPPDSEEGLRARVSAALGIDMQQGDLLSTDDPEFSARLRERLSETFDEVLRENNVQFSATERERMRQRLLDDLMGFGPLQPLLDDETISEVVVIGPERVYARRGDQRLLTDVRFHDADHLQRVVVRILAQTQTQFNENVPLVTLRLSDGAWLTVTAAQVTGEGLVFTLRKAQRFLPLTDQNLVDTGMASRECMALLRAAVQAGMNVLISGERGSGRTTLLNALLASVPEDDLLVILEDYAELQPTSPLAITLQTRMVTAGGRGPFRGGGGSTLANLMEHALHLNADRVVIGELTGQETYDLIQMHSVRFGSWMATVSAASPQAALDRVEALAGWRVGQARELVRTQISAAIDLLVFLGRDREGVRRILWIDAPGAVSETGVIALEPLMAWHPRRGFEPGEGLAAFLERLADVGIAVDSLLN